MIYIHLNKRRLDLKIFVNCLWKNYTFNLKCRLSFYHDVNFHQGFLKYIFHSLSSYAFKTKSLIKIIINNQIINNTFPRFVSTQSLVKWITTFKHLIQSKKKYWNLYLTWWMQKVWDYPCINKCTQNFLHWKWVHL